MKKNILLLLILSKTSFSQTWTTIQLTNFATINVPVNLKKTDTLGTTVYSAGDSSIVYFIQVTDMSKQKGFDSKNPEISKMYKGVVNGTIKSTQGTLVDKREVIIDSLNGIEMKYVSTSNPTLPKNRFKKIVYVGNFLFTYDLWVSQEMEASSKNLMEKYFSSFTINSSLLPSYTDEDVDADENSPWFKLGEIIGYLASFGILIGVIVIIRNYATKK